MQPEAVKRRKTETGSKNKISNGKVVRKNPFVKVGGQRKRVHKFSENVQRIEPVAKKAWTINVNQNTMLRKIIKLYGNGEGQNVG